MAEIPLLSKKLGDSSKKVNFADEANTNKNSE